ncbi:MAG: asparagine synthase C-terminal domain-containing protein [Candidatus Micrarchaeia archaeon]
MNISDAKKLAPILQNSVLKNLQNEKKIAIAFSGGLDSTTIAKIAMQKCDVDLITVGLEGSPDVEAAKAAAKELQVQNETKETQIKLHIILVDKAALLKDYKKMWELMPGTLTDIELMCAIYEVCKKAHSLGDKQVLFGSGAEELFVGYHKYYDAFANGVDLDKLLREEISSLPKRDIKRAGAVADFVGLKVQTPFMDKELIEAVFLIPAKKRIGKIEMKKPLLREIAKLLCVPKIAVERQKKAMQYGSNIHRIFLEMAKKKEIEIWDARPPFVYE